MITLWERMKMEPDELRNRFSQIIKKYNSHFNDGDYEVSFLISQSLFEDRINVLWVLGSWHSENDDYLEWLKPRPDDTMKVSMKKKIDELKNWGIIDFTTFQKWKNLIHTRNNLIHFSLFNIEEYTSEISSSFFNEFRKIDKLITDFKIKTDFYNEGK